MSPELVSYGSSALNWLIRISPLVSFAAFAISCRAFKTSKDQKHNSLVNERWEIYQKFRKNLLKDLYSHFYEVQTVGYRLQDVEIGSSANMPPLDQYLEEIARFFPKKLVKNLKKIVGQQVTLEQFNELSKIEIAEWFYKHFRPWLKYK